jgi:hypothetical protein
VDILATDVPFTNLSMRDLLEARDAYHWHLMNKENVVGTAIGLYRIRKTDPWPTGKPRSTARPATKEKDERTFAKSEVRDYSWPCVLVLVDKWKKPKEFGSGAGQVAPDQLVPPTLYLPDGRAVPVCVVVVTRGEPDETMLPPRTWPNARLGGGFPLLISVQGESHLASVGALVTDGHTAFALTSRHVAGSKGEEVSSLLRGCDVVVGRSAGKQLTRVPFSEVYRDFPAQQRTYLTLDAGLIEVDNVRDWTSRSFGLPPVGELADLNELNIGLRLIDAPVCAFGAASGNLRGRIAALFYRYRSIGGYDQVTDFLIAPDGDGPATRPGDSGTVWHLAQPGEHRLRPIALEWGGQAFLGNSSRTFNFTLAASLTNVLRLLDVELVTDHNVGAQPFWGKTGHYTIAALACQNVTATGLKTLMAANADRISFPPDELGHTAIDKATIAEKKSGQFMPMADVPDLIWKNMPTKITGGRDTAFNAGPEHPCHYADIDEPRPSDGTTLRDLCIADPCNVAVPVWQDYYHSLGHDAAKERGLLPFRVWQFFDAMVAAVKNKDIVGYLAAAGCVAHYVGDACQPLHGSYLSNGMPDGTGDGVHSVYEDTMVDRHDTDITTALPTALAGVLPPDPVTTGNEAAIAVVHLMDRTAHAVDPKTLVTAFAAVAKKPGDSSVPVTDALWDQFGDATIDVIADGIVTLAMIWTSAWNAGNGDEQFTEADLAAIDGTALQARYQDPNFVPSTVLDDIAALLQ